MTEKQLFLFCGIWFVVSFILGLISGNFWVLIHMIGYPLGVMGGWAIVTLIESRKGGKQ